MPPKKAKKKIVIQGNNPVENMMAKNLVQKIGMDASTTEDDGSQLDSARSGGDSNRSSLVNDQNTTQSEEQKQKSEEDSKKALENVQTTSQSQKNIIPSEITDQVSQ